MIINVHILSNDGRKAVADVSMWRNNRLEEDRVTFDHARDSSGRHRLQHELPLEHVDEVFGELMEAVKVRREELEEMN